jgi:RNA polymerase sigma factor (sigma-70 family)
MSQSSAAATRPSLLRRLKDGLDDGAWGEFSARYSPLILRYAHARGLQRSDAEDVCQLTLLKLTRTFRNFEYDPARGRFRDYLGRVVRSVIASELARPNARAATVWESGVANDVADPTDPDDPEWDRQWRLHHLERAMVAIRRSFDAQSIAIFDRLAKGAVPELLAAEFGVSRDAIYKVKQRVRDRLKELVRLQIDDEDSAEPGHDPATRGS